MMPLLQTGVAMGTGRMPKLIKPRAHAVIDYLVAGSFFVAAGVLSRRNKRGAVSSLICGGMITVNCILTDYPGGIWKALSFQTHGKLDAGLAALTATMPRLMGFGEDAESKFFTMQSMLGTAIAAMTDFDCYEQAASDRLGHEDAGQVA
jgi:hypothetical protein